MKRESYQVISVALSEGRSPESKSPSPSEQEKARRFFKRRAVCTLNLNYSRLEKCLMVRHS